MRRHRATAPFKDELGASVLGLLILVAVGYGIYTFVQYKGVWFTRSSLEHAVRSAVAETPAHLPDRVLRRRIARRATVARVPLEDADVVVSTQRRPGERIVTVSIEHPMTIRFFGERTVDAGIQMTESFPVDETAESNRLAREQKRAAWEEKMIDRRDAQIREAREECERVHGRGGCEIVLPGGARGF